MELVKRYYVTEKAAQLAKDLEIFSKKQRQAAENEEDKIQEQDDLNKVFEEIAKEMNELKKDNEDLKKPLSLEIDEEKAAAIKSDQKEASDELKKEKSEQSDEERKQEAGEKASKKQKTAAQKMKEMSEALSQSASSSGSGSTITEDAEMLRQILDNLLTFSFKQEKLFEVLETSNVGISEFSGTIREQQELRDLFEHVDDSLFALSLRRAELSEFVNKQITEVYYNIDKSLESIAENQIYQSVSHQKYVLSASNGLADFLARILDNMQLSMMSGSGSGEGQGFQLPDIIKGQGELKEKMKGKGKSGKGQPNDGEGKNGKGINEGQGKDGKKGREGNEGGNSGQEGQGNAQGVGQPSEKELQEIYEIYKSQQILREHLEQQLQDMIDASDRKLGEKIIRQMEDFEDDLLENGVTQRSLNKINAIQYELLKLENAALKQGKKQERESNSSENQFHNPITTKPSVLENYRNENEILNRHALPLRQIFKNKVKHYFKSDD